MTKERKTVIRYSISFKQKVVNEIEQEGLSIVDARRRYDIRGGQTIQQWLRSFGKNHLLNKVIRVEMKDEKDRLKELEAENQRLKALLGKAAMEKDVLETLIDVVNKHYQTDVKKNLGPQSSKGQTGKKDTP